MILDSKKLQKFLKVASEDLKGDWILIGGTLLPALGIDVRSTVDIDFVGLGEKERAQDLELMRLCEKLKLDVQVINQAAGFFLRQMKIKKEDLILLIEGKSANIFRPSVELYWKLKLERLSDSDATDCIHYLKYARKVNDSVSDATLKKIIDSRYKKADSSSKRDLLDQLAAKLMA